MTTKSKIGRESQISKKVDIHLSSVFTFTVYFIGRLLSLFTAAEVGIMKPSVSALLPLCSRCARRRPGAGIPTSLISHISVRTSRGITGRRWNSTATNGITSHFRPRTDGLEPHLGELLPAFSSWSKLISPRSKESVNS